MKLTKERIAYLRESVSNGLLLRAVDDLLEHIDAMLEAEAPKIVVGIDWARGAAPERCGGEPGKPNWQGSFRSGYHMGWHRPDRLCPAGTSIFICTPCPGCESCYDRRKIERRDRRKIERREPKGD